jgi:hypothetical protein
MDHSKSDLLSIEARVTRIERKVMLGNGIVSAVAGAVACLLTLGVGFGAYFLCVLTGDDGLAEWARPVGVAASLVALTIFQRRVAVSQRMYDAAAGNLE